MMERDELRQLVGSAIREYRVSQRLSQEKLALMVGSSKSHIWRIETGRVGVGLDDLGRIANALEVDISQLFSAKR